MSVQTEPTDELREEIIRTLERAYRLDQAADALLSGPLAPLLAKLRAVEGLLAFYDRHEYATLNLDDLRRALAGER